MSTNTTTSVGGGGDNLFGKIAITQGHVTPKELLECLAAKDSMRRQGKNVMLGQIMYERGYVTKEQVLQILEHQKKTDRKSVV